MFPQSAARIAKLKTQGKARRSSLLSLVQDEFTCRDVADASGIPLANAAGQIRNMVKWGEAKQIEGSKNPMRYRKV